MPFDAEKAATRNKVLRVLYAFNFFLTALSTCVMDCGAAWCEGTCYFFFFSVRFRVGRFAFNPAAGYEEIAC